MFTIKSKNDTFCDYINFVTHSLGDIYLGKVDIELPYSKPNLLTSLTHIDLGLFLQYDCQLQLLSEYSRQSTAMYIIGCIRIPALIV